MIHPPKLTMKRYRWTRIQSSTRRESGYLWANSQDDALSQLHQSKKQISDILPRPTTSYRKVQASYPRA
ncbi:hypothetical protein P4S72_22775 [Vibrio sp. PP-XX7]